MIQLREVDVVHIATPPHWHGVLAADAASVGKYIWCEKPITGTIGEGKSGGGCAQAWKDFPSEYVVPL